MSALPRAPLWRVSEGRRERAGPAARRWAPPAWIWSGMAEQGGSGGLRGGALRRSVVRDRGYVVRAKVSHLGICF